MDPLDARAAQSLATATLRSRATTLKRYDQRAILGLEGATGHLYEITYGVGAALRCIPFRVRQTTG
jgi:hypothetical protein